MTLYDLSYLGPSPSVGRCSGALAKAQALLCLMISAPHSTRIFGGDLHAVIGMSNADADVLLQAATMSLSGAVDYLNSAIDGQLEAVIEDTTITDQGLSLTLRVTYDGNTAQLAATIQE